MVRVDVWVNVGSTVVEVSRRVDANDREASLSVGDSSVEVFKSVVLGEASSVDRVDNCDVSKDVEDVVARRRPVLVAVVLSGVVVVVVSVPVLVAVESVLLVAVENDTLDSVGCVKSSNVTDDVAELRSWATLEALTTVFRTERRKGLARTCLGGVYGLEIQLGRTDKGTSPIHNSERK